MITGDPNAGALDELCRGTEDALPHYALLEWVFETGEETVPTGTGGTLQVPYRTVFARVPGALDDREPVADLAGEEVPDELGALLAAFPRYLRLTSELWLALDRVRSRDARWLGPWLRRLHDEAGELLREVPRETWCVLLGEAQVGEQAEDAFAALQAENARLREAGKRFADTVDQEQMRRWDGMTTYETKQRLYTASMDALREFRAVLKEGAES